MKAPVWLSIGLIIIHISFAEDFYSTNPQGWLNYNYEAQTPSRADSKQKLMTPAAQMQAFHAYFENVQDAAVMNPTETNVARYMALQNYVQNQSIHFSATWDKVLLDQPQLDYELLHPTDQIASQIDHNNSVNQQKAMVHELAKTYGMMFFYQGQDQYAQKMASSLQYFADQNGISLLGVSLDGTTISEIKDNQIDHGQANRMGVQRLPAIFLVNPKSGSFEPLSYGFVAENQLLERFYNVATDFSGQNLLTQTGQAYQ